MIYWTFKNSDFPNKEGYSNYTNISTLEETTAWNLLYNQALIEINAETTEQNVCFVFRPLMICKNGFCYFKETNRKIDIQHHIIGLYIQPCMSVKMNLQIVSTNNICYNINHKSVEYYEIRNILSFRKLCRCTNLIQDQSNQPNQEEQVHSGISAMTLSAA